MATMLTNAQKSSSPEPLGGFSQSSACSLVCRPETWQMQTTNEVSKVMRLFKVKVISMMTKCSKIRLQVSVFRTNGPLVYI